MAENQEQIGQGTCLIDIDAGDAGKFKGTGFHYGGGWLMSVAHNFQCDVKDSERFHSLLSKTSFTFNKLNSDGVKFRFQPRKRMAFIHHLTPGDYLDTKNMDIAMVKLGRQYEYGRGEKDYEDWEIEEQQQLDAMKLPVLATLDINNQRQVKQDDKVHAIHYGGANDDMKIVEQTVKAVSVANAPLPIIKLSPTIPGGASGSPILNEDNKLVGLFYGGGKVGDANATDDALRWEEGIRKYTHDGVLIIAEIGSYMAYKGLPLENAKKKASDEKQKLTKKAEEGKLTIYLMNGEVLNG